MDQRDFNRSMGAYINTRRDKSERRGFFDRLRGGMPKVEFERESHPEIVPADDVPKEAIDAVLRGESLAPQVVEQSPRPVRKQPSQGWFRRMVDSFTITYDDTDIIEDSTASEVDELVKTPRVDDEVKEMLRICVKWVNQLPPQKIQEIKRSDEYTEFKRLLGKYGLLKK